MGEQIGSFHDMQKTNRIFSRFFREQMDLFTILGEPIGSLLRRSSGVSTKNIVVSSEVKGAPPCKDLNRFLGGYLW
jgi:hypothetical protein